MWCNADWASCGGLQQKSGFYSEQLQERPHVARWQNIAVQTILPLAGERFAGSSLKPCSAIAANKGNVSSADLGSNVCLSEGLLPH